MSELAEKVQQDLVEAIDNDDLVLPTLPEVALQIRKAAEDPEISIGSLSKVIGRDAALSARLIKVVNSPLLRAAQEVTDLHTAITRLGINYSSNLAIGLVMEQIFHARSAVVEQKMRDVWRKSLEIAGVSYALCRNYTQLKPDQAALGGLVHQIGVLPILTYAEDHYELLADPVSLNHVIDRIHPMLGDKRKNGCRCRSSISTSSDSPRESIMSTWSRWPACTATKALTTRLRASTPLAYRPSSSWGLIRRTRRCVLTWKRLG